jgi:hypothetical protein
MSPTIRSKGGLPLMVGGQVAGSQECCCENPPPPFCECSDYCPYIARVVAPAHLVVASLPVLCDGPGAGRSVTPPSDLDGISCSPTGWSLVETTDPLPLDYAAANVSLNGNNLRIGIETVAQQRFGTFSKQFPNPNFPSGTMTYLIGGTATIGVGIFCDRYNELDPVNQKYYAIVTTQVFFGIGNPLFYRWHQRSKQAGYELPSYCVVAGKMSCYSPGSTIRLLEQPIEITADGSTTSLGAYQTDNVVYSTREQIVDFAGEEAGEYIDCVMDAVEATFRITSRDTCEPEVYCDCASITEGLTIVFNYIGGWEFIWNDEEQTQSYSDLGAFYSFTYSPQGPGNEARVVIQQWNLSVTEMYYQWTMDIFCEAIPSGIPSPYRWYGSQLLECFEYDSGSVVKWTQQTLLGHFNCQADPCGTNGRSLGDLYPAGAWRDVEYFDRVTPDGYVTCNPGGPIDFEIRNDAECP